MRIHENHERSARTSSEGLRLAIRRVSAVGGALALGLLMASSARAQCMRLESDAKMTTTKLGTSVDAIGTAGFKLQPDCSQLFGLNVVANLPDGEQLTVMAVTKTSTFTLGAVIMFDTFGQMVTVGPSGPAAAVDPFALADLKMIQVYRNPNVTPGKTRMARLQPLELILQANF